MTGPPSDAATGVEGRGPGRDWVGWSVRVALVVYLSPVLLVVLIIGGVSVAATATYRSLIGGRDDQAPAGPRRGSMVATRAGVASRPTRPGPSRSGSGARG